MINILIYIYDFIDVFERIFAGFYMIFCLIWKENCFCVPLYVFIYLSTNNKY